MRCYDIVLYEVPQDCLAFPLQVQLNPFHEYGSASRSVGEVQDAGPGGNPEGAAHAGGQLGAARVAAALR